MIKKGGVLLWVQYFDKSLSRSRGRRVAAGRSLKSPSPERIVEAAERLGWRAEILEKSHPRQWWKKRAAIMVYPDRALSKSELIRLIAEKSLG